jgi:hypothetical protein
MQTKFGLEQLNQGGHVRPHARGLPYTCTTEITVYPWGVCCCFDVCCSPQQLLHSDLQAIRFQQQGVAWMMTREAKPGQVTLDVDGTAVTHEVRADVTTTCCNTISASWRTTGGHSSRPPRCVQQQRPTPHAPAKHTGGFGGRCAMDSLQLSCSSP